VKDSEKDNVTRGLAEGRSVTRGGVGEAHCCSTTLSLAPFPTPHTHRALGHPQLGCFDRVKLAGDGRQLAQVGQHRTTAAAAAAVGGWYAGGPRAASSRRRCICWVHFLALSCWAGALCAAVPCYRCCCAARVCGSTCCCCCCGLWGRCEGEGCDGYHWAGDHWRAARPTLCRQQQPPPVTTGKVSAHDAKNATISSGTGPIHCLPHATDSSSMFFGINRHNHQPAQAPQEAAPAPHPPPYCSLPPPPHSLPHLLP
jgi:hypothetical protein